MLRTLNSIYDARFASHCASSISKAIQKMLSNAMSSSLSNSRKRIPARVLGVPATQTRRGKIKMEDFSNMHAEQIKDRYDTRGH